MNERATVLHIPPLGDKVSLALVKLLIKAERLRAAKLQRKVDAEDLSAFSRQTWAEPSLLADCDAFLECYLDSVMNSGISSRDLDK